MVLKRFMELQSYTFFSEKQTFFVKKRTNAPIENNGTSYHHNDLKTLKPFFCQKSKKKWYICKT